MAHSLHGPTKKPLILHRPIQSLASGDDSRGIIEKDDAESKQRGGQVQVISASGTNNACLWVVFLCCSMSPPVSASEVYASAHPLRQCAHSANASVNLPQWRYDPLPMFGNCSSRCRYFGGDSSQEPEFEGASRGCQSAVVYCRGEVAEDSSSARGCTDSVRLTALA